MTGVMDVNSDRSFMDQLSLRNRIASGFLIAITASILLFGPNTLAANQAMTAEAIDLSDIAQVQDGYKKLFPDPARALMTVDSLSIIRPFVRKLIPREEEQLFMEVQG